MFSKTRAYKDNSMGKLFISIWKIDADQDYFDIRLILLPERVNISRLYEVAGICQDLNATGLEIKEFATHEGESLVMASKYVLQQINNEFAFNKEIDDDGDGMKEWISRADSIDLRLFVKSVFDVGISKKWYE